MRKLELFCGWENFPVRRELRRHPGFLCIIALLRAKGLYIDYFSIYLSNLQ